ncbi:hypothetical protein J2W33_006321 [Variovorax boronicumulans]|nr:hypothetical protein [Variovorax boronicumulans]
MPESARDFADGAVAYPAAGSDRSRLSLPVGTQYKRWQAAAVLQQPSLEIGLQAADHAPLWLIVHTEVPLALDLGYVRRDVSGAHGSDANLPLGAPKAAGEELESLLVNRSVHRRRGSWFQIGPEVPDDR